MEELARLATLLAERNRLDDEIAAVVGRPALTGHIGEFIARHAFDIALEVSATTAGIDGRFRSGALAGRSVNVKFYAKRENCIDIPAVLPDFFLVLTGPRPAAPTSRNSTRPLVLTDVFVFEVAALVASLRQRGTAVGVASSVPGEEWDAARIWPTASVTPFLGVTLAEPARAIADPSWRGSAPDSIALSCQL